MEYTLYIVALIAICISLSQAVELTFELPDNERMCFFEDVDKGVECELEFQVITGGHYDVDMELTAPSGKVLYKDVKKQYDSFTWTTDVKGVHKFCFSNEFSTFSHKVVYFDFVAGDDDPLSQGLQNADAHATAMTLMESAAQDIHESLNDIDDTQTHFKLREAQGRAFAEDVNQRVMIWSISESIIVLVIGIGQVVVLRGLFSEKNPYTRKVVNH